MSVILVGSQRILSVGCQVRMLVSPIMLAGIEQVGVIGQLYIKCVGAPLEQWPIVNNKICFCVFCISRLG